LKLNGIQVIAAEAKGSKFIFETEFTLQWLPLFIVFVCICLLTVFIGLINSRAVVRRPPLEILREEV